VLLLAALLGYAVGAAWLIPAFRARIEQSNEIPPTFEPTNNVQQSDPRSASLRMAHTLVDALLATAIILVWQRLYGAEETGWMSALLRVLGFLPALVHVAWAQVLLARGHQNTNPWWLGIGSFALVGLLGLTCAVALHHEWLDLRWRGVWHYLAPLVLWQGCACLSASFSHRPFQTQSANTYSWSCMALGAMQALVLITPMALTQPIDATGHMIAFAMLSGLGLLGLTLWMARLR
jgi:uncharacterized membrane protein YqaE (UPF0057 family)